jgi:exonuclease III
MEFEDFYLVNTYVPNSGMKLERLQYRTSTWDPALSACLQDLDKTKPVVWTGDLNVAHGDDDVKDPIKKRNKVPGFTDSERENFGLLVGGVGHVTEEQAKKRSLMVGRPGPDDAELPMPPFVDAFRHVHGEGPVINAVKKKKTKTKKKEEEDDAASRKAEPADGVSKALPSDLEETGGSAAALAKRRYSFWSYRFKAKEKDNGWRLDYFVVSRRFVGRIKSCEVRESFYKLSDHCPVVLELH